MTARQPASPKEITANTAPQQTLPYLAFTHAVVQSASAHCSFSFGGRGIYFGGKDVLLSELSGAFAITAETGQADKQGVFKSATITMQFGGAHLASVQRYLRHAASDYHNPRPAP